MSTRKDDWALFRKLIAMTHLSRQGNDGAAKVVAECTLNAQDLIVQTNQILIQRSVPQI
jgi:hypothetical protein